MNTETEIKLPESKLVKHQVKTFRKDYTENGEPFTIIAEVRHDDECGNGHNTFAITANIYEKHKRMGEPSVKHKSGVTLWLSCCGCQHDEVSKHFPDLAPLIKWHLTSTDGPMHYVANTLFNAGNRDCHGLRKGEFQKHTSRGPNQNGGVEGVPNWVLKIPEIPERDVYSPTKPEPIVCEWEPYGRTGEGKERELDAARSSAVWPEATDEQLCSEPEVLKALLLERLPALMEQFKKDVESLGFTY